MGEPEIVKKLRAKGLDLGFLTWLEGPQQRLPRTEGVIDVPGPKYAAAIRAAAWLKSQCCQPELIEPSSPQDWMARYERLEGFLVGALKYSMVGNRKKRDEDLAALEDVLTELLPSEGVSRYRSDIQCLRKRGQPLRLKDAIGSAKRSGGRGQSEQVRRMRAAIEYLLGFSKQPYADLAKFWNAQQDKRVYYADQIRSLLRKGDPESFHLLQFWKAIYDREIPTFPGPIP